MSPRASIMYFLCYIIYSLSPVRRSVVRESYVSFMVGSLHARVAKLEVGIAVRKGMPPRLFADLLSLASTASSLDVLLVIFAHLNTHHPQRCCPNAHWQHCRTPSGKRYGSKPGSEANAYDAFTPPFASSQRTPHRRRKRTRQRHRPRQTWSRRCLHDREAIQLQRELQCPPNLAEHDTNAPQ